MTELGAKEFFSITEAARKKKVSRQAIHVAIQNGRLPAKRVGRQWIISKEDLRKYVPKY